MKLTPRERAAVTIIHTAAKLASELLRIEQGTPPRRPAGRAQTARDTLNKIRVMPLRRTA